MKKSRFSPEQIAKILKDYDNGITSEELCRLNGISRQTFYKWRSKYAGMESADLKRLKQLEEENGKLKRMYDPSWNNYTDSLFFYTDVVEVEMVSFY